MDSKHYSDLGDQIRNMVDDAVNSRNFSQLNKNIGDTINDAVNTARQAVNYTKNPFGPGSPGGFNYKVPYGTEQTAQDNGSTRYRERTRGRGTYQTGAFGSSPFSGQPYTGQAKRPAAYQNRTSVTSYNKSGKSLPGRVSGVLFLVFGSIIFGIMILLFLILGIIALASNSYGFFGRFSAALILPLSAAGIVMIARGSYLRKRIKRYRFYLNKFNGRSYCSIRDLASGSGKSQSYVLKDVKKMIQNGMFPEAHLDDEETSLMLNNQTYEQYLKMKEGQQLKAREEAARAPRKDETEEERQLRLAVEEGQDYIRKIRQLNDDIPGEEISRKLDRTELILKRIFSCLEKHPEQLPDMKKFMSYYLPTTLKLVNAYREFDQQPVEGENIATGKREIEKTMDTINEAFENLLDDLFQDTAWDISSDISVLKTMLAQEGLTEDEVTRRAQEAQNTNKQN